MTRRALVFILLFLFATLSLFAGGQPENSSWYVPDAAVETNGSYYDLSVKPSGNGNNLMQIGSTLDDKTNNVKIAQVEPLNDGSFCFINDDNNTQKWDYKIYYKTVLYKGIVDRYWWISKTSENTQYVPGSEGLTLDAPFKTSIYSYFQLANFTLTYEVPTYGALEPGTYTSTLNISFANNSGGRDEYQLILHAKYMTSVEDESGSFKDFYFSILPTDASYNLNLKAEENATTFIPIADVSFVYTATDTIEQTYPQHPFQVAVTPSPTGWGTETSDDALFKKVNIGSQDLSSSNSVAYTLKFEDTTSGYSTTPLVTDSSQLNMAMDAHHTVTNSNIGNNTYYNKFIFDGKVSIKITGDTSDLTSGRYQANIYYYIIKN